MPSSRLGLPLGDYAGASPDPAPTTATTGEVWLTNMFPGVAVPDPAGVNWRTWIWAAHP